MVRGKPLGSESEIGPTTSKGPPKNKWEDSGEYWASVARTQKAAPASSNRNAEDAANDGQDRKNHTIYSVADPKCVFALPTCFACGRVGPRSDTHLLGGQVAHDFFGPATNCLYANLSVQTLDRRTA